MKIFVTGASGFIGQHLIRLLQEKSVIFIAAKHDVDICDLSVPSDVTHIIHLAAESYVPDSWERPENFLRTNTLGTQHILEEARKASAHVVFMSSYVYGPPAYLPVDENHPVQAFNPYCLSKVLAEQLCHFWAKNFDLNISVIRPFNIYGEHQRSAFLIPTMMDQFFDPECSKIVVQNTVSRRDYLHVSDLCHLIFLSLRCTGLQTFNAGSGSSFSVKDLWELMRFATDMDKPLCSSDMERKNEVSDVVADIRYPEKVLGWKPEISLEHGIRSLVRSYQ
ncbi:MAG: NAD(P)-dependent oxidoreductase [Deltaproteobacteria bacterium]|nr:NAD(P)-dependent oxidoreductase [Deltaproteobacteria bacterium]